MSLGNMCALAQQALSNVTACNHRIGHCVVVTDCHSQACVAWRRQTIGGTESQPPPCKSISACTKRQGKGTAEAELHASATRPATSGTARFNVPIGQHLAHVAIRKDYLLQAAWVMCLDLTRGEVEHLNTAAMSAVPCVDLWVETKQGGPSGHITATGISAMCFSGEDQQAGCRASQARELTSHINVCTDAYNAISTQSSATHNSAQDRCRGLTSR